MNNETQLESQILEAINKLCKDNKTIKPKQIKKALIRVLAGFVDRD